MSEYLEINIEKNDFEVDNMESESRRRWVSFCLLAGHYRGAENRGPCLKNRKIRGPWLKIRKIRALKFIP